MSRRALATIWTFGALVLLLALLRLCVFSGRLEVPGFGASWADAMQFRAPRALAAAVIGAALGAGGVVLQSMLRNPLASPDLLGITSGAGLGVVAWVYAAYAATGQIIQYQAPLPAAMVGALGAAALVFLLSQRRGIIDPVWLILVGVMLGVACGAGVALIRSLLPDGGAAVYGRWVMGSINEELGPWQLGSVSALTVLGVLAAAWMGPALDALSLGDDEAASVGVRVGRVRVACLAVVTGLSAGSVVLAGPIGFVGLIAPHITRALAGPSHRPLVLGAALAGASLMLAAEIVSSALPLAGGRVPPGVITALVGVPVFVVLLRRRSGVVG
ncbi:MAG: iron ABC transporter permease [Phycisphaerales bacterium]|nr:iron ABC transporter permease [Phycisphaerales bacterium]